MAASTNDLEKRLDELKKEVTQRGFDRHASLLKNISELPTELQSPTVTALDARETLQTIIVFPQQIQRGWHYVSKQALLFTATGMIHLLASIWQGEEPQVTAIEGHGLLYMKVKLLLLYGSLELVAQGQDAPIRLTMEFSTVDWYCLSPSLKRFLQTTKTTPDVSAASDFSLVQETLTKLPLKFSNGMKIYGLLPGETLEELVFEPGTWKRWLYFFRQPFLSNSLLALTTHYLVVIQEEVNVKQGWVISYIPRNNIDGIQNQLCDLWNELSIQLKRDDQLIGYKLMLKHETVEAWRRAWVQHGGRWDDLPSQQN